MDEEEDESFLSYLNPKRRSRIATLKRYPDMKSVSLIKNTEVLKLAIDFYNRYRPGNEIEITLKPSAPDLTAILQVPRIPLDSIKKSYFIITQKSGRAAVTILKAG